MRAISTMRDGRVASCRSITAPCCCSAPTRAVLPPWSAPCAMHCGRRCNKRSAKSDALQAGPSAAPAGFRTSKLHCFRSSAIIAAVQAKGRVMPELSVVVPVFNERDNIPPLVAEISTALRGRVDYEIVYVDDRSSDDSLAVLQAERARHPELRIVKHLRQSGQSTAIWNGVRAARGKWIA